MLESIVIIKVCYLDNEKRDSVKSVKAARFISRDGKIVETMGNVVSWSKGQIIQMITDSNEKVKVFTATIEDERYLLGPEVEVYFKGGSKYIRVIGSNSDRDDLDILPVYQARC